MQNTDFGANASRNDGAVRYFARGFQFLFQCRRLVLGNHSSSGILQLT